MTPVHTKSLSILHLSHIIWHLSHTVIHLSHTIWHLSYIILHLSCIILHLSHTILHLSHHLTTWPIVKMELLSHTILCSSHTLSSHTILHMSCNISHLSHTYISLTFTFVSHHLTPAPQMFVDAGFKWPIWWDAICWDETKRSKTQVQGMADLPYTSWIVWPADVCGLGAGHGQQRVEIQVHSVCDSGKSLQ